MAHSYFTTPDAGPTVSYPGDGTELDWEYDEERSRYYVRYPDDQYWRLLLGFDLTCGFNLCLVSCHLDFTLRGL